MKDEMAVITKSDIVVTHPYLVDEALKMKHQSEGDFISGGTLIQLNWEANQLLSTRLINLQEISQIKGIEIIKRNDSLFIKIGALTTIAECIQHPIISEHASLLIQACTNIAAPAVRNRATIGGNVASGIGDSIPALLALDAELIIRLNEKTKIVRLWEWLQIQKESTQSVFLLMHILIPCEKVNHQSFFKKIGRREAFTPALVTVSALWEMKSVNEFNFIRIAVGGGNHSPRRLIVVEKILETNHCDERLVRSVHPEIIEEFISYSDPFASESYRKQVAANLLVGELLNIFQRKGEEK